MNKKLLMEVRDAILANPKHVNMATWVTNPDNEYKCPFDCGTTACIAGWASYLAAPSHWPERVKDEAAEPWKDLIAEHAAKRLAIKFDDCEILFDSRSWPWRFRMRLLKFNPGTKNYAKVVAARIDHFIETGE
jgi:hypothetical protein